MQKKRAPSAHAGARFTFLARQTLRSGRNARARLRACCRICRSRSARTRLPVLGAVRICRNPGGRCCRAGLTGTHALARAGIRLERSSRNSRARARAGRGIGRRASVGSHLPVLNAIGICRAAGGRLRKCGCGDHHRGDRGHGHQANFHGRYLFLLFLTSPPTRKSPCGSTKVPRCARAPHI